MQNKGRTQACVKHVYIFFFIHIKSFKEVHTLNRATVYDNILHKCSDLPYDGEVNCN